MNTFIFVINKRYYGILQASDGAAAKNMLKDYCYLHQIDPVNIELKGVTSKSFSIYDLGDK